MRLSDLVAHPSLAIYPQIGLVLFLLIFAGVALYVARAFRGGELDRARRLPLEDGGERLVAGGSENV